MGTEAPAVKGAEKLVTLQEEGEHHQLSGSEAYGGRKASTEHGL